MVYPDLFAVFSNRGMIASTLKLLRKLPLPLSIISIKLLSLGTVYRLRNVSPSISYVPPCRQTRERRKNSFPDLCSYRLYSNESFLEHRVDTSIILRGQKDRIVSESTARHLALSIGAKYIEVPGVGHTPMVEFPSAYCAALVQVLREKPDGI